MTRRSRPIARTGRRRCLLESLEQRELLAARVLINEVHYDPDVKTEPVEFVELYNAGDQDADLSGWSLVDGIEYVIPPGTTIPTAGYVIIAQDPTAVQQKFGVAALGPFRGKLSNERDRLILFDDANDQQDEVAYRLGFPWPTVGDSPGNSIELIRESLDNNLGGSWRPSLAGPTPGRANSQLAENAGPQLRQVEHAPQQPTSQENVRISVKATDVDDVASVTLAYQVVAPGDFISINDPRFAQQWTSVEMRDDGTGGDETAGDDVYTASLSADLQQHRHLVRYAITATDGRGASVTGPYPDDPVPNFAYYVYDGIPAWSASPQPGVEPVVTYDSQLLQTVPAYQLITTREAHVDSHQLPGATIPPYEGRAYLWDGALVYEGEVYDHIRYRARGGVNRYARGKNSWKFDFNRGHPFQAHDDYGNPYDATWDKLNLAHVVQQERGFRGDHGMAEAVSFGLFGLAGIEGPNTHFVHLRVVEDADEFPADQYATDFQGLYLAIEQPDGRFLDEHGLPDGNLYKIELDQELPGSLNNQGPTQPDDSSDLLEFVNTFQRTRPTEQWWRENFDLARYYSYRSIVEAVRHYDIADTNQFYYHHPETGRWSVHPWDLDLTWRQSNVFGSGGDAFAQRLLRSGPFATEYRNRTREILDLLFNHDQTGMLIEEKARFIYTPNQPSFVDADRAMWDYNPILGQARAGVVGQFYENSPTGDFAGMLDVFRRFIDSRTQFIERRILTDERQIPRRPAITYTGDPEFPFNELSFGVSPYESPTGSAFDAIQWRLAEVTDVNRPEFDPSVPRKYEINATWDSGELATLDGITVEGENLNEGRTYRARVRVRDADGRWSHWSEPMQFVAGPGRGPHVEGLRVTEINYHPHDPDAGSSVDSNAFEFIEFQNVGGETLDLSGVSFQDAIDFTFVGEASDVMLATFDADAEGFQFGPGAFGVDTNTDAVEGGYDPVGGMEGGALRVVLGPGIDAEPRSLLETSFDSGSGDFTFEPVVIGETTNPDAVSGFAEPGSLAISIGPGDTGGPASGAWSMTFELTEANDVILDVTHALTNGPGFESTEFGEAFLAIDGIRLGTETNDSLAHLAGKSVTSTDVTTSTLSVHLDKGQHTLALGAFNNQATDPDEHVHVSFHNVAISLPESGAIGPTSGGWSRTIQLPVDGTLEVSLDYRLIIGEGFEPSEITTLILEVDGVRYGVDMDQSIVHHAGGQPVQPDWTTARVHVPLLAAGDHSLSIGVHNSGATAGDEFVEVMLDNIRATLFQQVLVAPGETVLVVADQAAFESRYGMGHRVVGTFQAGKLNNGGERVVIKSPMRETIHEFTYDDNPPWPKGADGRGSTLEIIDPSGDYNSPSNWRASPRRGGSPGLVSASAGVPGDSNGDGAFDQLDIALVIQHGKYMSSDMAAFAEGDWNDDGRFDTLDIVFALQQGTFGGAA